MARLPDITTLGQRPTPEPRGGLVTVRGGTGAETAVGEALARAGGAMEAAAEQARVFQEREAERNAREQEKFDRTAAEAAFTRLREAQLDLTTGEQNGFVLRRGADAIAPDFAQGYEKRFDEAAKQAESGLTTDRQRELFKARADAGRLQFRQDLMRHRIHEDVAYRKQVLDGTLAVETRMASAAWQSPADVQASLARIGGAIDLAAENNGLAPEAVQSLKLQAASRVHTAVIGQAIAAGQTQYAQSYFEQNRAEIDPATAKAVEREVANGTQKALFDGYQRTYLDQQNSRQGLATLERSVMADKTLDEGRKNVLLGRIMGKMDQLDRRAEMARARFERGMERQLNAVNALTLKGFEPSAAQLEPLVTAAKGTAYEAQVDRAVQLANATRAFRLAAPQQQERLLIEMERKAREDPTKIDLQILTGMRSIYEGQQRAVRDDPISFAIRQGQVAETDPAAAPLDLSKPETLGPQLIERATLARGISSRYGAPLKVLTKEEADTLGAALKRAPASEKTRYFGALSTALAEDAPAYKALMSQIAPDDPVTAIAGTYASNQYRDAGGKSVSDLILRGQEILRPARGEDGKPAGGKLWPMPKDTDLQRAFAEMERDAFSGHPKARNDYYQTALAIYAAKAADAGDASGEIDSRRWNESVRLATGGIERWNGRATLMPYGMSRSDFRDGLRLRIDALVESGALAAQVSAGRLYDMPLDPVGEGRYVFRAGDSVLVGKDGRPVVIDFNEAPPLRLPTSGRGSTPSGETAGGAYTGRAMPR